MAPAEHPREQEHSIKARKNELFEKETSEPRRPFTEYLAQAPTVPLSQAQKVMLWGVGVFVLLLFLVAMLTIPSHHGHIAPSRKAPASAASTP